MVKINKHLRNTANIESYNHILSLYNKQWRIWFDTSKSCLPSRRAMSMDGTRKQKTEKQKIKIFGNSSYPLSYRIYIAYIYIEREREKRDTAVHDDITATLLSPNVMAKSINSKVYSLFKDHLKSSPSWEKSIIPIIRISDTPNYPGRNIPRVFRYSREILSMYITRAASVYRGGVSGR